MTNQSEAAYPTTTEKLTLGNIAVSVRHAGSGPTILLLHGFPHTKQVWRAVEPVLIDAGYRVVSPDLRGLGDTDRTPDGYHADDLAMDQVRLLDALSSDAAHVVGFDLGAAPAFALAAAHPGRVRSLTVVEAILGGLPGAEAFLAHPPWWFGFHQAPGGLAEDVLEGDEGRYIRHFLATGSEVGVPHDLEQHFVDAYTGHARLRAAFEHYRAMPGNARWSRAWAEHGRLPMPVAAIGASAVEDALARQLATVCDDLTGHLLPRSGHIVPVDAPRELAAIVLDTAHRASIS
ncbi:alpha/beta fold hydrolase [Tsukamurella sp. 8F]|uniref:alpha/beta fold hydrolase n=1 Tax=unclassified Tsukamurella TaxID=2633480 RepID=UPI0023B9DFC0|nr:MULTISPECIES: alpha/beta fold hydrolase [unclassified Tsukamurella]MDF0530986.1 alpha/beta fold hydrolase [Tsukamurella sp. 8J]MDF0588687.1 alpha/beta fold hydrolase [Tsukamurella sp. 8F]